MGLSVQKTGIQRSKQSDAHSPVSRIGRHKTEEEISQLWSAIASYEVTPKLCVCVCLRFWLLNWTLWCYHIEKNMFWIMFQIFYLQEKGIIKMIFWLEQISLSVNSRSSGKVQFLSPAPKQFHQALQDLVWPVLYELFPWLWNAQYFILKLHICKWIAWDIFHEAHHSSRPRLPKSMRNLNASWENEPKRERWKCSFWRLNSLSWS